MRTSLRLAGLTALGAALASSGAASGQSASTVSLADATTRAALELCPASLEGKLGLNDAAALAPFGVAPAPDSAEAPLREKFTGVEMARGTFASGTMTVLVWDPHRCIVVIGGNDRLAARDTVMAAVAAKGGTLVNESTEADGSVFREFKLGDYSVTSQTRVDGSTSIGVTPMKYRYQ